VGSWGKALDNGCYWLDKAGVAFAVEIGNRTVEETNFFTTFSKKKKLAFSNIQHYTPNASVGKY